MTTREPLTTDVGEDDPDARLGAFRDEKARVPGAVQPPSQAPSTHVEPEDAEPVPDRTDNTGIAPS